MAAALTGMLVSEKDIKTFQDDGVVVVRQVVSPEWVDKLRDAFDWAMNNPSPLSEEHVGEGEPGRFFDDQFLWKRNDSVKDFVFNGPLAKAAATVMSSEKVNVFYDHVLVKEPNTKRITPWHNDMSYWPIKGSQICSIWIALDDVSKATSVKYVKGSHKQKLLHKVSSLGGDSRSSYGDGGGEPLPDIDALHENGELELVNWDLKPGDVLIHHGFTIHGAPGNINSTTRRRGYVVRWLGDDMRFDPRPGTMYKAWTEKGGYHLGLAAGDTMNCDLFPSVNF
ncbi:unnamed protein product [Owenia fusiformis]|uniref:Uncharacterized protein n=1 Tax=Owenia fusiformis TaxID=6347 RepID=A0A8J1UX83_OWEFU|nr:unnamed protein product [Owenia fusiformis]